MYGYLNARPTKREVFNAGPRSIAKRSFSSPSVNPQPAGYLTWEGISYFFGRLWGDGFQSGQIEPPTNRKLTETEVDSDLIKEQKRQVLRGLLGAMGDTIEYTVTSYDTLPKIALKFDVTPSELSRLNKMTIRTLYPGQVLRVPCPKPKENCSECFKAAKEDTPAAPQSLMMDDRHREACIAKRVSFDDIDEDVLETFIKIKSKYITDGQGVLKGSLLITPHAVIFHPDVSEILVVERGSDYYKVHFTMHSVCAAGMFDDIASMVLHETLQPGHFFLDKPLMEWLGNPNTKQLKEEDSSSTLHPSTSLSDPSRTLSQPSESLTHESMSLSQEQSVESLSESTESVSNAEQHVPGIVNITDEVQSRGKDNVTEETKSDNLQNNTVTSSDKVMSSKDEQNIELNLEDRTTDEMSCSKQADSSVETSSVVTSSVQKSDNVISSDSICADDVILSSSNDPSSLQEHPVSLDETDHVTSTEPALQMYSTPKLRPYKEVSEEAVNKERFIEGVSKDSGIHESAEDVQADRSMDRHEYATSPKEIVPQISTCHVDMPKYLCVKIKKSCWRELRPSLCSDAHEAIQRATDERREFWFSIPSDRLLEVYAFFLEWCPAIHDGDTDDEKSDGDTDFVRSLDSDYSVLTMPKSDDESFEVVDNFYSNSPGKENVPLQNHGRKRTHSREKKKKRKEKTKEPERKASSWSTCSLEEPLVPEVIGKSEILTSAQILQLSQCLPSRTIGHSWCLLYSTYEHGISLKTLYRSLVEHDTPVLLVILDDCHQVFGAFASSPFAVSEHFYGTGECFLYTFHPHFKAFRWSGENNFFIKGDMDSLAFGGGHGNFGLWLDEDLYHGSSHHCKTFNNGPLSLKEDFLCSGVEVWGFQ